MSPNEYIEMTNPWWTWLLWAGMFIMMILFGLAFSMPPSRPGPPEPRPKPKPLRPKSIERTNRGTDPKYTWRFTPDNCFDCGLPFREQAGHLPFYTVVIDCRMTRCCPECFPKYQDRWMG